jgi:hypothetical protein
MCKTINGAGISMFIIIIMIEAKSGDYTCGGLNICTASSCWWKRRLCFILALYILLAVYHSMAAGDWFPPAAQRSD